MTLTPDALSMPLHEAIDRFARLMPDYYVHAGNHRFGCSCPPCVTFHVLCGLDLMADPDPEWAALRAEPVPVRTDGDRTYGEPSDDQIARLMRIADRLL